MTGCCMLEPFDLSEYHKRQRGQSDREEYNQRKSKGHFFQMNIYVHAIKLAINVGSIKTIDKLVIRFMIVFTLFEIMEAKASIVPVRMSL